MLNALLFTLEVNVKNKMHHRLITIMLCFVLAFSLTACYGNNNSGQTNTELRPAPPMLFTVNNGNETIIVNENGEEVMRGQFISLITNMGENGVVAHYFIAKEHHELVGYSNEYGYPLFNTYSTVYDGRGTVLLTDVEGHYRAGYGNYLLYSVPSYLIEEWENSQYLTNPFTGDVIENISYIDIYSNIVALHSYDYFTYLTDFEGNVPQNYPTDLHFSSIEKYGDYYITEYYVDGNLNTIAWDSQFNQLTRVYGYDIEYIGGYFICKDSYDGSVEIYDPIADEIIIPDVPYSIFYYNGEVYAYYTQFGAYIRKVADNSIIASVNIWDLGYRPTQTGIINRFYYQVGDIIYAIDASGNEIARVQLPNSTGYGIEMLCENLFYTQAQYEASNGQQVSRMVLIDENLNVLDIGTADYMYMESFTTSDGETYITAIKSNDVANAYNSILFDVLDAQGNLLVENLKSVRYEGGEYLYVESGFYVGIMRLDGTWLYKASIFNNVEDETGYY